MQIPSQLYRVVPLTRWVPPPAGQLRDIQALAARDAARRVPYPIWEPVEEPIRQKAVQLYLVVELMSKVPPLFEQLVERQFRPAVRASPAERNPVPLFAPPL